MSVTLVVVLIVAVCVVVGLALYVLDAPGRAKRPRNAQERLERSLAKHRTFEKAEEKFQAEQAERAANGLPPTHERP